MRSEREMELIRRVLRKAGLPVEGVFPYIPPTNWNPSQPLPRGRNKGYIDWKKREWITGRSITPGQTFEWDVQIDGGADHINIDLDGKISH